MAQQIYLHVVLQIIYHDMIICRYIMNKCILFFVLVRGSTGISLSYGPPKYEDLTAFVKDDNKSCKAMVFSPDGKYFAWISASIVKIALCSTWKVVACIEKPKVCAIQFSPLGTYLMTWEPFIGRFKLNN